MPQLTIVCNSELYYCTTNVNVKTNGWIGVKIICNTIHTMSYINPLNPDWSHWKCKQKRLTYEKSTINTVVQVLRHNLWSATNHIQEYSYFNLNMCIISQNGMWTVNWDGERNGFCIFECSSRKTNTVKRTTGKFPFKSWIHCFKTEIKDKLNRWTIFYSILHELDIWSGFIDWRSLP